MGLKSPNVVEFSDGPWDDIIVPAFALATGAAAPDLVQFLASGNLRIYGFNGSGSMPVEAMYGAFEFLHSYKEGSDISIHVHWCPTSANSGDVKWQLEYSWADMNATFPALSTTSVTQAAGGTAWATKIASFPTITGTGKHIGSAINFRLFRDPGDSADTYADDAGLLCIGVHFQKDTLGSIQMTSKT